MTMTMRRWWWIAAIGLSSASCRSCGCFEGEKIYEHIDEPIKVELVRETKWVGGKIPGPMSSFSIRIHANPQFEEPTTCTKAQLGENDVGTLVAFRCIESPVWTLIRLGKAGRHFRECNAPLGSDDDPDFSHVPPLSVAAAKIVGCYDSPASQTYAELFENLVKELHETQGDGAVVRFLIETLASDTTANGDPWTTQVLALKASDRELVLRGICPVLRDKDTTAMAWIHAAALCPLEDKAIADAALERVRAAFKDKPGQYASTYWDPSFVSSAAIAMRTRGADVGTDGCAYLGSGNVATDTRESVAYAAIGFAKTACPIIMKQYGTCDRSLDCDGSLCSAEGLRPEIDRWANQTTSMDGGVRTFTSPGDSHRALLAATWAQGPLPADIVLSNARRNYTVELGDGSACWQRDEAGVPCACSNEPPDYDICNMKIDGGRFSSGNCSFLVDDKKKVLGDTRHACGSSGFQCISDTDCCIDTKCSRPPDGGVGPSRCAP